MRELVGSAPRAAEIVYCTHTLTRRNISASKSYTYTRHRRWHGLNRGAVGVRAHHTYAHDGRRVTLRNARIFMCKCSAPNLSTPVCGRTHSHTYADTHNNTMYYYMMDNLIKPSHPPPSAVAVGGSAAFNCARRRVRALKHSYKFIAVAELHTRTYPTTHTHTQSHAKAASMCIFSRIPSSHRGWKNPRSRTIVRASRVSHTLVGWGAHASA